MKYHDIKRNNNELILYEGSATKIVLFGLKPSSIRALSASSTPSLYTINPDLAMADIGWDLANKKALDSC
jgi:hypothetical protein